MYAMRYLTIPEATVIRKTYATMPGISIVVCSHQEEKRDEGWERRGGSGEGRLTATNTLYRRRRSMMTPPHA
jgi:hypothetical protein